MAAEYQSLVEGFTVQLPPTMLTPVIGIREAGKQESLVNGHG
jgi:hypothetical protein